MSKCKTNVELLTEASNGHGVEEMSDHAAMARECFELTRQIKELTKRKRALVKKMPTGRHAVSGEEFDILVSRSTGSYLSVRSLRSYVTDEIIRRCTTRTDYIYASIVKKYVPKPSAGLTG